jgi:hypothetical protein
MVVNGATLKVLGQFPVLFAGSIMWLCDDLSLN